MEDIGRVVRVNVCKIHKLCVDEGFNKLYMKTREQIYFTNSKVETTTLMYTTVRVHIMFIVSKI